MSQTNKQKGHGGKRPGAGRKPTPEKKKVLVAVRISQPMSVKLNRWAAKNEVNRTQAIEEAIRRLTNLD